MALAPNQSPDMLNCIPLPGRLIFRGGYDVFSNLPGTPDNVLNFYDSNGAKHIAVWAGGNLYDCVSGIPVLVPTAGYTAGNNVGCVELDGKAYWSSLGQGGSNPVPLRVWDPALGTEAAVVSAGGTGVADPPASGFLFLYTNCIVALAPFWGTPIVTNVYQPNVFTWCGVNDPTRWFAANSQAVGDLNDYQLEYGRPFGIAGPGVSPFETILIMRNDPIGAGIFAYSGALGQLQEHLLNCPFGIKSRFSAQYLPTTGTFGEVVWLGTDGQVWSTNGLVCTPISNDIIPSLQAAYTNALNSSVTRFYSGYNQQWQYYYVDLNGQQFGYRWQTKAWFPMQGWPSGISFISSSAQGVPGYYVASAGANNIIANIGLFGQSDNGIMPSVYWKSPIFHGDDAQLFKEWHWGSITTFDTGATYAMSASSIRRSDGTLMVAQTVPLVSPADTVIGAPFKIGSSIVGGPDLVGGAQQTAFPGIPIVMQERFAVPIPQDEWTDEGDNETLKGNGIQVTIAWEAGAFVFDLTAVEVLYVPRGYLRGAGTLYNPEDITEDPYDPWSNM